jgi:hypothetical protein
MPVRPIQYRNLAGRNETMPSEHTVMAETGDD